MEIKTDYLSGIPTDKATELNGKKFIIIHNTATPNATADAENAYFHREWMNIQAFVHAFVDWNGRVIENAKMGDVVWGAGRINAHAWLQVEQCISADDSQNVRGANYLAEYVATKIKESGIPFDQFEIIDHRTASAVYGGTDHDDSVVGMTLDELKAKIASYVNATTQAPQTPQDGKTFRLKFAIRARAQGPDTKNPQVYLFHAGDKIAFDRKLTSNGYEWISQPRASGGYWYIPIREVESNDYWGDFE